jgi:uncharacterized protein CbrC (UPF0167 family)
MNSGDVLRMAKEAHIEALSQGKGMHVWHGDAFISDVQDFCVRFAELVAAEKEKQIINILERLQERNESHSYYKYAINVIKG